MQQKKNALEELWLKEEVYHTVSFLDYDGNLIQTYRVKHGEYLSQQITTPRCYVAVFTGWTNVLTGKAYDARLPILENSIYQSEWLSLELLMQNGLNMAEMDVLQVDVEAMEDLLRFIKEKQKEQAE